MPVTRKDETIGVPEGVDAKHPRLGLVRRQSESGSGASRAPESESLMGDKGVRYRVEPVTGQHGY